jgi:hypothetical protein
MTMQKPNHISAKRWQQHLTWMQVTGETKDRHVKQLADKRKQQSQK